MQKYFGDREENEPTKELVDEINKSESSDSHDAGNEETESIVIQFLYKLFIDKFDLQC